MTVAAGPLLPEAELAGIALLGRHGVFDSFSDGAFDRITGMAVARLPIQQSWPARTNHNWAGSVSC